MLQDNVRYGNEAQLLGGYSAGWLLLSAVMALAYLGPVAAVRCAATAADQGKLLMRPGSTIAGLSWGDL